MLRVGLQIMLFSAVLILSGCLQSPEDQLAQGVSDARTAFEEKAPEPNEAIGSNEFYVPRGYEVEQPSDGRDVLITRGDEAYTLFFNPNEAADSTLFYDLQKTAQEEAWIVDEKFSQNGRFGFVTVRTIAEGRYELVVSSGGTKLSAVASEDALRNDMGWMMKTVRSAEAVQKE